MGIAPHLHLPLVQALALFVGNRICNFHAFARNGNSIESRLCRISIFPRTGAAPSLNGI
jgi:hypothetical protein